MKLLDLISEARRNPELNNEQQGHAGAYAFLSKIPRSDLQYYGVSMTKFEKLGINPQSEYDTPRAVCFYPAVHYLKLKKDGMPLEFVDDAPYIHVIEIVDNVVFLDSVSSIDDVIKKLHSTVALAIEKILGAGAGNKQVSRWIDDYVRHAPGLASVKTPAGELWYILRGIARQCAISEVDKPASTDSILHGQRSSVIWNKLLRLIGWNVVVDNGEGILHPSEPWQGMAFSPGSIKTIKMFNNTPSGDLSTNKPGAKPAPAVNNNIWEELYKLGNNSLDIMFIDKVLSQLQKQSITPEQEYFAEEVGEQVYKLCIDKPEMFKMLSNNNVKSLMPIMSSVHFVDFGKRWHKAQQA